MPTASMLAVLLATFSPQQGGGRPPDPAPTRAELPANETIRIHGTAVAVDPTGTEHAHEDGWLRLAQWPTGLFEVPVHDGKFEATVVAGAKLLMPRLQLAGRSVDLRLEEVVANADRSIELRGPWEGDLELKVVDAATKTELTDCEWIHDPSFRIHVDLDGRRSLAGESAQHVASPLKLAQAGRYWVRAPGHAWQLFFFEGGDAGTHGEATLALPKACTLDVVLPDPKSKEREWLVVDQVPDEVAASTDGSVPAPHFSTGTRPLRWYVRRGASATIRLESLPPGRFLARTILDFEMHPWFPHEVPFASATADVAPDRENRLTIASGAIPDGLHEDGTVDRTGLVTIAGAKPGSPAPKSGTLEAGFGVRDVFQREGGPPRGVGGTDRITRDGIESSLSPPLEVVDGKVRLRCPYGCLLWINQVTLDGVEIPLSGGELVADTTTEPFTIEIPDPETLGGPTTIVHVVDKETRAELPHVSIAPYDLDRPQELRSFVTHPGPVPAERLVVADGTSPVRLRDRSGRKREERLFVRASGFAWTTLQHDWTKAAERTVELERACDLSITLDPPIDTKDLVLAVYRTPDRAVAIRDLERWLAGVPSESHEFLEFERGQLDALRSRDFSDALIRSSRTPVAKTTVESPGATVVEGLPRAALGVALYDARDRETLLGVALVDASAGGTIPVVVPVRVDAVRRAVPLAGTAIIPQEWGSVSCTVELWRENRRSTPTKIATVSMRPADPALAAPGEWTWNAGEVIPGSYRARIDIASAKGVSRFSTKLVVGVDGDANRRIEVPRPCDVVVELVDDATGEPVVVKRIDWSFPDDSLADPLVGEGASARRKPGVVACRAPMGPIVLQISDPEYGERRELLDLPAGELHVVLRMKRCIGIHLHMLHGSTRVVWDYSITWNLESLAPDGTWTPVDLFDDSEETIFVPAAGRYRITFEADADDEDGDVSTIPPIEVTVPAGAFVDVDVQLPEPKKAKDG